MPKSIVLIGPAGSGTTSVGRELSELVKANFVDLDAEIQKDINIGIPEFVTKYDWERFRQVQSDVLYEIGVQNQRLREQGKRIVLAAGGEVLTHSQNERYRERNVVIMGQIGSIGYILPKEIREGSEKIDILDNADTLAHRLIKGKTQFTHPLHTRVTVLDELVVLLKTQDPLYKQVSQVQFYTKYDDAKQIAAIIFRHPISRL